MASADSTSGWWIISTTLPSRKVEMFATRPPDGGCRTTTTRSAAAGEDINELREGSAVAPADAGHECQHGVAAQARTLGIGVAAMPAHVGIKQRGNHVKVPASGGGKAPTGQLCVGFGAHVIRAEHMPLASVATKRRR
jgi:hypothetical protein